MSVLTGISREVYVLAAPPVYVATQSDDSYRYWCGGNVWSPTMEAAVLFQDHTTAQVQAKTMNLRDWSIHTVAIPPLQERPKYILDSTDPKILTMPNKDHRLGAPETEMIPLNLDMVRAGTDALLRWDSENEPEECAAVEIFYSMLKEAPETIKKRLAT